ncbi:MAG: hypothetical protein ABI925_11350 [Verrucomicrobiota bacterium]
MSKTKKGNPIPTKFDPPEEKLIVDLNSQTGLSQSEVVRRAVRLLRLEIERRGSRTFLFEELGPGQEHGSQIIALRAADESGKFKAKRPSK